MNFAEPCIDVQPLKQGERGLWQGFLPRTANGTLFHNLDFLDYHPAGRFSFEHLVLRQKGEVLAVLPGGPVQREDGQIFVSPLGASAGGPAVRPGLRTVQALAMVQALQMYASQRGWNGIDITLPPQVFAIPATEAIPFALFSRGFQLTNRWLCAMLDLQSASPPLYRGLFSKTKATDVNAARRKGMRLVECGREGLDLFLGPLHDTYTRHGVAPTHSDEEIAWLLEHLPGSVRLYLAMLDERCAAGVLCFNISDEVVYTFYICSSEELFRERGTLLLFAELADVLAERGVRWLDLGPTSSDANYNSGVTFFKESLGCVTHCRDRWSWRTDWTAGPALAGWNFMEG